jgi:hypothetical protein
VDCLSSASIVIPPYGTGIIDPAKRRLKMHVD